MDTSTLTRLEDIIELGPEHLEMLLRSMPDEVLASLDSMMAIEEPMPQPGPQTRLVLSDVNEILFGGGRGGGKSYGALIDWYYHQKHYGRHAKGLILRKVASDLDEFIETAQDVLDPYGVFKIGKKVFVMDSGAILWFKHLEKDKLAENFQGWGLTWICVEEVGQFATPKPINALRASLRSAHGVPVRLLLTANPGGLGHGWLKARFVSSGEPNVPQVIEFEGQPWTIAYMPANVHENLELMAEDPGYIARLYQAGEDWLVEAWVNNDWDIVVGDQFFGDLFQTNLKRNFVIPNCEIPSSWPIFRALDWGSARPFSIGWWTVATGEALHTSEGPLYLPRGSVIRVHEWYGCSPDWQEHPNTGIRWTAREVARRALEIEKEMWPNRIVFPGAADPAIYSFHGQSDDRTQAPTTIADELASEGMLFVPASDRSRVSGWEVVRTMLKAAGERDDAPGLYVMRRCVHWLRLMPEMTRSATMPEDMDTNCEDHIADETRYQLVSEKGGFSIGKATT
jgi:hypothetical protein